MESLRVWYDRDEDMLKVIFADASAAMEEIAEDVF